MTTKICTVCKQDKPASREFFCPRDKGSGLEGRCRECKRAWTNAYLASKRRDEEYRSARNIQAVAINSSDAGLLRRRRYMKAYRNTEKYRSANRKEKAIRKSTPKGLLDARMRGAVRQSLRGRGGKNGASWEGLVGYTVDQLVTHIERQFPKSMDWSSFERGEVHIDHILPLSSFKYTSPGSDEFRAAWALTNLRPLWAADNLSKNDRRTHLI